MNLQRVNFNPTDTRVRAYIYAYTRIYEKNECQIIINDNNSIVTFY